MINKIASSPSFKSEVRTIYAPKEEYVDVGKYGKLNRGKDLDKFYQNFYNSKETVNAIKEIEEDNRGNIVTFFPSRGENGRSFIQMHVLNTDSEYGKSAVMTRVYSPREIMDQYLKVDRRRAPINEDSTKVYDYIV